MTNDQKSGGELENAVADIIAAKVSGPFFRDEPTGPQAVSPVPASIPDAGNFRIVCLQVSKKEPGRSLHSMTQHWGYYDSEDEAVGAAMRKIDDLKPGFSVDGSLVASPFAIAIEAGTAETEGLGAQHESAGRRHRPETVAAPIPVEGEVLQADRNAAVRLLEAGGQDWQAKEIRLGEGDHFPIVQAFARHRLTFSRGVDERAQIVAWLRGVDHNLPLTIARVVADAIERGDHLSTIEEPRG